MSRSKREPIWTEGYGSKNRQLQKRQANKRVRKSSTESLKELAGGNYKKKYDSWNIVDIKIKDYKNKAAKRK